MSLPADSELARHIRDMGHAVGTVVSSASQALFLPLHAAAPPVQESMATDLAYGPHARHRLDVHAPTDARGPLRPVLLFVHGGGFVKGDKAIAGSFAHANVCRWAVRHGFVGARMNYRLAPEAPWPAGGEDVGAALQWLRSHVGRHGGDPQAIFLFGHSAGAAHVATWLVQAGSSPAARAGVAGCLLLSGNYDQTIGTPRAEYYGTDASRFAGQSTVDGLSRSSVPLLLGVAEYDPPDIARHTARVLAACASRDMPLPRFVQAEGHNHYTITHHLGTEDERLGAVLAAFVTRHARHADARPFPAPQP